MVIKTDDDRVKNSIILALTKVAVNCMIGLTSHTMDEKITYGRIDAAKVLVEPQKLK